MKKLAALIVLGFLVAPFASLAQSPEKSIETLSVTDMADDSIVMLSQEETGLQGYVNQKYAFLCLGELQLVDYYGAPLDPKDENVIRFERQMCSNLQHRDDGSDSE
jgi:hypothetical protein